MIMGRIMLLFLFVFATPSALVFAGECPVGPKDTALTFTQVMINFGKFTRNADMVATLGEGSPTAVKESQLDAALVELPNAIACATTVANDTTGTLLPASALETLTGADLENYAKQIKARMNEFVVVLEEYLTTLKEQKAKAEVDRDYSAAAAIKNKIKTWVGSVHDELTL